MTSPAHTAADRYFAAVNARDVEALVNAFTASGTILLPIGGDLNGSDAIRSFYTHVFQGEGAPSPQAIQYIDGDDQCAVEMVPRVPEGSGLTGTTFFERFTVDDDEKIVELSIFWRQP
jgi:hypothetical protein